MSDLSADELADILLQKVFEQDAKMQHSSIMEYVDGYNLEEVVSYILLKSEKLDTLKEALTKDSGVSCNGEFIWGVIVIVARTAVGARALFKTKWVFEIFNQCVTSLVEDEGRDKSSLSYIFGVVTDAACRRHGAFSKQKFTDLLDMGVLEALCRCLWAVKWDHDEPVQLKMLRRTLDALITSFEAGHPVSDAVLKGTKKKLNEITEQFGDRYINEELDINTTKPVFAQLICFLTTLIEHDNSCAKLIKKTNIFRSLYGFRTSDKLLSAWIEEFLMKVKRPRSRCLLMNGARLIFANEANGRSDAHCFEKSCENTAKQTCSGCDIVKYCSRECQKKDWKNHKVYCNTFR